MIHLIAEGEPLKYGISFYRLSDKDSFGFRIKIRIHDLIHFYTFRYSKITKHLCICKGICDLHIDPETGLRN